MNLSMKDEILNLSRDTGYDAYGIERMIRLFDILQAVERDGFLRDRFGVEWRDGA